MCARRFANTTTYKIAVWVSCLCVLLLVTFSISDSFSYLKRDTVYSIPTYNSLSETLPGLGGSLSRVSHTVKNQMRRMKFGRKHIEKKINSTSRLVFCERCGRCALCYFSTRGWWNPCRCPGHSRYIQIVKHRLRKHQSVERKSGSGRSACSF
jgi:hypothetical protein